ncbi:MAG: P-loop NTPase fold protein, partial [Nitrososphaerales archaeon]
GALGAAILGIALLFLKTTGSFVSVILKYLAGVGMVSITVAAYTCVKDFYDRVVAPFDLKLSSYVQTPDYRKQIGFLGEFEVDFRRVIKAITTPSEPLVIFVDDLDRCSPTGTAGVIEAINVLLDADNCVYVIGMDSRAIASSLEVKYAQRQASGTESDDPGGLSLGDRFLEKIIQIQFNIPVAHTETLQKFAVANLNLSKDLQSDKKAKRQIIEAEQLIEAARKRGGGLDEAAATVRDARPDLALSAVDQAKKAVYSRSLDDSEEARTAIRSVLPYLGSNPRKIVRFINLFRLQAIIANRRKLLEMRVVDFGLLAKWLIIATRWTGVMETLVSDSAFKSKLETARNTQNTFREHEETGTNLETLRTAVNLYLEDPRVKKWINSTDLVNLLKTMSNEEIKTAPIYLHLTQITATIPPSV